MSAIELNGEVIPRMKISDNPEKITNPGSKELWRFYDRDTGFALADLITLADETIDDTQDLEIFDPQHTWKRKTLTNFRAEKLLKPIFVKGQVIYPELPLSEIRKYCADQLDRLWDSVKRFENPQTYYVDLSQKLCDLIQSFLT